MKTQTLTLLTIVAISAAVTAGENEVPNVKLSEWQRGFAVSSLRQRDMSVYLWFYEWNMFEAMEAGQTGERARRPRKVGRECLTGSGGGTKTIGGTGRSYLVECVLGSPR